MNRVLSLTDPEMIPQELTALLERSSKQGAELHEVCGLRAPGPHDSVPRWIWWNGPRDAA
ncbi:hypothetical protein ACWD01_20325 [Streptomyces sp. NPDC002835]